jgi:hypothetical protein
VCRGQCHATSKHTAQLAIEFAVAGKPLGDRELAQCRSIRLSAPAAARSVSKAA